MSAEELRVISEIAQNMGEDARLIVFCLVVKGVIIALATAAGWVASFIVIFNGIGRMVDGYRLARVVLEMSGNDKTFPCEKDFMRAEEWLRRRMEMTHGQK